MGCAVEGCERSGRLKLGYCPMHYTRFHKHGDPLMIAPSGRTAAPAEERFWRYVTKRSDGCWIWRKTMRAKTSGYGIFRDENQRSRVAHRWAYEHFVGPIPEGLQLDHLCRVRACVNPEHLEPVTNRENVLRGIGLSAQNARKTHCKRGHPLSGENLWVDGTGGRQCRMCRRATFRRWYWRKQGQSEKTGVDRKERFRGGTG